MVWNKIILILLVAFCCLAQIQGDSLTTSSGSKARKGPFQSGELIFEENFDTFNLDMWSHENTLAGGGNWEFQWYTNNRSNSFVEDGVLNIRPSLTSDQFGEEFLRSGTLSVHGGVPVDQCTNEQFYGCVRVGTKQNVLNPVKSARIRTVESFNFRYGKVEVSAKLPSGDWLWPAIWFLPKNNGYGTWPASGEIDLLESRGNRQLIKDGKNIGVGQFGSTLHFGPNPWYNGFESTNAVKNTEPGKEFNKEFNKFQMIWTPDNMTFLVNDDLVNVIQSGEGFWNRGNFDNIAPGLENPWRFGTKMAPFDQEFHFIINLAIGGVNGYFPDDAQNPSKKPWANNSPTAATDFWDGRSDWLPTWNLNVNKGKDASLLVDYVKVWAL